jgi:pyrrolidone-carboxylate peptidase
MNKFNCLATAIVTALAMSTVSYAGVVAPSVEEQRISSATMAMPDVVSRLSQRIKQFESQLANANNYTVLTQLVLRHGNGVWLDAKASFNTLHDFDDRPLYWSRLQMSKALKSSAGFANLLPSQQDKLLWTFELLTRGQQDVKFDKNTDKKILITGFDPFFLDRHIDQSNPSGVVALALDDIVLSTNGKTAEIEVLIVPVRFADFDQGMIEELLAPYIADKNIDLLLTVSMGREHFDLERYPALRRSAKAPDNLNVLTGASATNPIVPLLNKKPLSGPEFVEFSLPIDSMLKAKGEYQVVDNRKVATLSGGKFEGKSLTALNQQTSASGSGGGYLSNEISYRSILLRDQYQSQLPVGHIHTPRIKAFDQQALSAIVKQTKNIISQAVLAL